MIMTTAAVTHCFHNITRVWYHFHELHERDAAYHFFQGILILPIALTGLLLCSLLAIALGRALRRRHRRISNKFYVLVLNRTIGDLLACAVSTLIAVYVLLVPDHVNSHVTQLMNVFLLGCFWSSMITYVSIALLKLFGVAYPLQYQQKVTKKTCIRLVQINWMLILLLILLSDILISLVDVPVLREWSGCEVETCLYLFLYQMRNLLTAGTYSCTLACTLVAVMLIRHRQQHSNSKLGLQSPSIPCRVPSTQSSINSMRTVTNVSCSKCSQKSNQQSRLPLAPLLGGLLTLAIFHFPSALHAIYLLLFTDKCFYLRHYVLMQKWMGLIRLCLLIRITLDVMLAFGVDKELRLSLRNAFSNKQSRIHMEMGTTMNTVKQLPHYGMSKCKADTIFN